MLKREIIVGHVRNIGPATAPDLAAKYDISEGHIRSVLMWHVWRGDFTRDETVRPFLYTGRRP
jgi:hypothetical protein